MASAVAGAGEYVDIGLGAGAGAGLCVISGEDACFDAGFETSIP